MVLLLSSILLSSTILISFKVMNMLRIDEQQTITFNYLFATLWGYLVWQDPLSLEAVVNKPWFASALVAGFFFIAGYLLIAKSSIKAGVAITAVSGKMSVIIPVISGILFFHERLGFVQIIGILLSLVSFLLIFKPRELVSFNWRIALLPTLLFFVTGINDTVMKIAEFFYIDGDTHQFLFVVYLTALFLGSIQLLTLMKKGRSAFAWKNVMAGFILGSLNFGSTYLFIESMMLFPATFIFPVFNVSVVSITALCGLILFKEKLAPINWFGIIVAIFAILMISVG